jgi:hypothetical protein
MNGHTIRYSDSSFYDFVCVTCGARDWTFGPDEHEQPCPKPAPECVEED